MNANQVHFIASDAHDCLDRTPDLSEGYKYVSARYGAHRAEALFIHNPKATLRRELVPGVESPPPKRNRRRLFGK